MIKILEVGTAHSRKILIYQSTHMDSSLVKIYRLYVLVHQEPDEAEFRGIHILHHCQFWQHDLSQ
jgi:hypothetical protein